MKKFLPFLLIMLIATPALALTLAEKKQYQDWQEDIAEDAAYFKEKCGYELPVTMNESMVTPFMEQNTSASSYCEGVIQTMASMCEDALSKQAITEKVKSVTCDYKKGETKGAWSLNEGMLTFSSDVGTPNISEETQKWLENNL